MKCELIIADEVNVRFRNVDPATRRRMVDALKFFIPKARHMPAYKLGRWDGTVSYCTAGGGTFINLLDRVLPVLQKAGYEIEVIDQRVVRAPIELQPIDETFFAHIKWPKGHRFEGEPIMLEEHQVRTINNCVDNPQSLQEVSTGAGKTITTAALSTLCDEHGRTIVIVPNKDLVLQTEADYKQVGLDVGVFYGDRKDIGRRHTICTWQSLNILDKKAKDYKALKSQPNLNDIEISEFLDSVVGIIVDEVHQAKSEVLKRLLAGPFANIPLRWGLTGTIPKEEHDFFALLAAIGPVVGQVTAKELQEKGFLAECHVDVLQLVETVEFDNWQEELSYLTTDDERLKYMADLIKTMAETGNTLVLVDRLEAGKKLSKYLNGAVFISGDMKTNDRKTEYAEINVADSKIVIATYGVAAVGLNIPRIFNLVLIEAGKSFVRTIQSIGRGLRKAKDKNKVNIYDMCSTTKFSKRHLTLRKKYYDEAGYKYKIHKVDYRKQLR